MTILKVSPRSNYSAITNAITKALHQTSSDAAIRQTIATHLEKFAATGCYRIITLLNKLRHQHTNYDQAYQIVLGQDRRAGKYSREHFEVSALVNESFLVEILKGLEERERAASSELKKIKKEHNDLKQEHNELKDTLDNLQQTAIAALTTGNFTDIEDLILELATQ